MKKNGTKRKYTTITIPTPLFERIEDKIKNTGFSSVSDCVTYILRETMATMESDSNEKNSVIERLKALGYT
ncbi:MAG: ribbon-helix-helix domain-containing protein [Candidatus Marsarchaeota archaeon]|jgi:Arc/MetJ-type ribon-helix-helix transcriptional regulator|nr:ribbon-helix-helix domain-containing protein [Candidatus Marsarchaeota archaeon]